MFPASFTFIADSQHLLVLEALEFLNEKDGIFDGGYCFLYKTINKDQIVTVVITQ